ncbi:MAG: alpha/beta hydrolase [Proteobacteria bacterium]|nr:alpha/beta hydrolase [Pseudomonadota bacterium]
MSRETTPRQGLAHDRELLPVRCGYADTRVGQLHYRSCGAGPDVLLLHWAPASGRMYEHVLPLLARAGFRGLAFDLPGYGRSHKQARGWGPERIAREVLDAAQSLNTGPITVVGGHASAAVAIEMLLAEPQRVVAGVLDGVIALTTEETKALMSAFAGLSPRLQDNGGHRSFPFDMTCAVMKEWRSDFKLDADSLPAVYELMRDYLETGYDAIKAFVDPEPGQSASPRYDVLERLKGVTQPLLVLTADDDALLAAYPRALAKCRNGQGFKFSGAHPLMDSARSPEYASVITNFALQRQSGNA